MVNIIFIVWNKDRPFVSLYITEDTEERIGTAIFLAINILLLN